MSTTSTNTISEENLSLLRKEAGILAKKYASSFAKQAQTWEEKAWLAYLRLYVHPQATWSDACLILGKIACVPSQAASNLSEFPYSLFQQYLGQSPIDWPVSEGAWLFHRLKPRYSWQWEQEEATFCAQGFVHLGEEGQQLLFPFASSYEQFLLKELEGLSLQNHWLSATWADAYELAMQKGSHNSVYFANALCLPLTAPTDGQLFETKDLWRKQLGALAGIDFDWISLNLLQWPLERFERGNSRLFEELDFAITDAYLEESRWEGLRANLALRQLAWAMERARGEANLMLLAPKELLHSPIWEAWRKRAAAAFDQILILEMPSGLLTCWCLRTSKVAGGKLLHASMTSTWTQLEWEPFFVHEEGYWYPAIQEQFWNGLALFPPSLPLKKEYPSPVVVFPSAEELVPSEVPAWVSGLTREEAIAKWETWKLTQTDMEALPEPVFQERLVHPKIKRWSVVERLITEEKGLYWHYVKGLTALPAPPLALGVEKKGYWLPVSSLSKRVLQVIQKHYWEKVPLPKGIDQKELLAQLDSIEKLSKQLPVLQKYTKQLEEITLEYTNVVPYEAYDLLREVLGHYQKKIELLYPSARERKGLFERLLALLHLLEGSLKSSEGELKECERLQEEVNSENLFYYVYAVLSDKTYINHYEPKVPLLADFWGLASQGAKQWEALSSSSAEVEVTVVDSPPSLPILLLNREKRALKIDAQYSVLLGEEWWAQGAKGKSAIEELLEVFRRRYLSIENIEQWLLYREELLNALGG